MFNYHYEMVQAPIISGLITVNLRTPGRAVIIHSDGPVVGISFDVVKKAPFIRETDRGLYIGPWFLEKICRTPAYWLCINWAWQKDDMPILIYNLETHMFAGGDHAI